MKIKEFTDLLKDGLRPVIEFKKGIEESDAYAETGMRARAIGVSWEGDSLVQLLKF